LQLLYQIEYEIVELDSTSKQTYLVDLKALIKSESSSQMNFSQ